MKYKFVVLLIVFSALSVNAQTCGFGCLGFSGAYGGYTLQKYDAEGLNSFLESRHSGVFNDDNKFSESKGFRLGINVFKARFDDFYFGAKFFYQFLDEEKSINNVPFTEFTRSNYKLEMNNYGVGGELGFPVFSMLDFKLVEAGVTFNSIKFTTENYIGDEMISDEDYESSDSEVGYYVGTGLVIHIIKNYVSIEGTASYNFLEIEKVESSDNTIPSGNISGSDNGNKSFINAGGLSATVQFNLSFPL